MSFLLTHLSIKKKITAIFHDPDAANPEHRLQNLNVATAAGYLNHVTEPIPVDVEPSGLAKDLLGQLAVAANRTITYGSAGLLLAPLPVDQQTPPPVELSVNQPRQERAAAAEPGSTLRKRTQPVIRKYPTLASVFMRAPAEAQILSVYKTKDTNPAKVAHYKAALAAGDCTLTSNLPPNILDRLQALDIAVLPEREG